MTQPGQNRMQEDSQAFVVRLRINGPPDPALQPPDGPKSSSEGRLIVHVEHVNSSEQSLHRSIEDALDWLRQRMTRAVGLWGPVAGDAPDDRR